MHPLLSIPDDAEVVDDDPESIGLMENADEDAISIDVRGIQLRPLLNLSP